MIKSSIVTAGFALISLLCLSSSSLSQDSDYIELPFEFFHGRWVQGHSAEFKSTYVDYQGPDYFGSYNFIFGNNRLSILDIQKYILVNEKFESWRTANISFLKRVKPNWQVGIDGFTYSEFNRDWSSATFPPFQSYSIDRNTIYIVATSKFSKNETLRINAEMEAYSYFFEPILSKGELRFENLIRLRQNRQNYFSIFTPDSISSGRTTITDRTYHNWLFRNDLIWGITDRLNLVAIFASINRKSNETSYYEFFSQGSLYSLTFEKRNSSSYRPWILLSVTQALTTNSFLKFGYQEFLKQSFFRSTGYSYVIETSNFRNTSSESERKLETIRSIWSANFQYINTGEFRSGVLLDDYQNYYKGMLFKGQLALDIGINYIPSGNSNAYSTSIIVLPTLGVSNNINIGGKVAYYFSRNRWNQASEEVQSSLSFKFRSYSYNNEAGLNWKRDSRYDQVFGRKLGTRQLFFELRYFPPRFSSISYENVSFFSFAKMRNSKAHIIAISAIVGLGANFELTISGNENYHTKVMPTRRYNIGLSKRILTQMDLSMSYIQSSVGSKFSDPTAQISIKALI